MQFILVSNNGPVPPLAYGPFTNDQINEYESQGKITGFEVIVLFSAEDFAKGTGGKHD